MADIVDRKTRSRMMSAIPARDTKPEVMVRKALFAAVSGCTGRIFRVRRTSSCQDFAWQSSFMAVSGTYIKTADSRRFQKQGMSSGQTSCRETSNAIWRIAKHCSTPAGVSWLSGSVQHGGRPGSSRIFRVA